MKKIMVIAVAIIALFALAAWAQQSPTTGKGMRGRGPMMYDPSKAQTIEGEVTAVNELSSGNGEHKGVVLNVNAGGQTVVVHVGPDFYLKEQSVKIAVGDKVDILGVKSIRRGQDVFLAGEIKKNGEVLKLRDANGVPLWAGTGPRAGYPKRKAPVGC